jgi:phospho-N-acetylmuramoyl-pentapeptide-transferase
METELAKIFILTVLGFAFALFNTPILTNFLYRNKIGKQIRKSKETPLYSKMHAGKAGTPTMGGILVWGTTTFIILFFWFTDRVLNIEQLRFLNFLTRRETLLPLGAFLGASVVGMVDDWLDSKKLGHEGRGLRFRFKIWLYLLVAAIGAWWFYYKLEFSTVNVPFLGNYDIGLWFLPFFVLSVTAVSFAVDLTDGLDGLAGGSLMIAFFCFGVIAFLQGRSDLTAMIAVVCGSLLAFLWFNVHPARFFMGDTGAMGMGVLLAIVAFLTNSIFLLALIGFVFMVEALSTLTQIAYRKLFKKKLLLSSPLHHHFEALGWPEAKVTMRFWIIAAVTGIIGIVVYFIG